MSNFKYQKHFEALAKTDLYKLKGATLLVEILPKEEMKTAGGIILGRVNNQRATSEEFRRGLGLVLLEGDGYDGGVETDIKRGMVIMLPYNPMYLSEFPGLPDYTQNSLALVNEGDVLFYYKSFDDYQKAKEVLQNETERASREDSAITGN